MNTAPHQPHEPIKPCGALLRVGHCTRPYRGSVASARGVLPTTFPARGASRPSYALCSPALAGKGCTSLLDDSPGASCIGGFFHGNDERPHGGAGGLLDGEPSVNGLSKAPLPCRANRPLSPVQRLGGAGGSTRGQEAGR